MNIGLFHVNIIICLGYPGYPSPLGAHPTPPFGGLGTPHASRPPAGAGSAYAVSAPQQYKPSSVPAQHPSIIERERREREERERREREERERREREERDRRDREERERREREERERRFAEQQRARDLELRGVPATSLHLPPKGDKERNNGAESDRDRSPIRSDSSPQIIEVGPPSKPDDHLHMGSSSSMRKEDAVLDMTTRPTSSSSSRPHPPSSADKPGSRGAASSSGGDDEIFIVAEKEGTRPRGGGVAPGPHSGSDPMHHRLNGLDDPRLHTRNSPAMLNGPSGAGGHKPGSIPGLPPTSLAAANHASYYSRSLLSHDPYLAALATPTSAYSLAASHHHQLAGLDPRTAALMPQPLLGNVPGAGGLGRPPANPYDPMSAAAALDPFRDPYRDLFRDPLREARDRELMDRAKMMQQLAVTGYSLPPGYYSTLPGAGSAHAASSSLHKLVAPGMYPPPPHSSSAAVAGLPPPIGLHGLMGGLPPTHPTPPGLSGHHSASAVGLSGHPSLGINGAQSYKDPTRR
jgi:hypothetical protein